MNTMQDTIQTVIDLAHIEESIAGGVNPRRGDTVMSHGKGCWLWDTTGNRFLDLTSSQGVAMLGHAHPKISQAIAQQASQLMSCPSFFYNETRARLLATLQNLLPSHLNHIFLTNSGAESIDGAIKFARLATNRTKIVACMRGFHGRTIGALSVTWEPKYRKKFAPLLEDVSFVPYGKLDKLRDAINGEIAALLIEPVQGEGGVNMATPDFFQGAQSLCREHGTLLVVDEIQTGFGRTGRWFGHQHYALEPDIMCMAKGIGAGFPMGAIAYTSSVREALFPGAHGSTFGGNPLACAASLAALETYQSECLIERADEMGMLLRRLLDERIGQRSIVRDIRGMGLMIGIELRQKVSQYLRQLMFEHQVLALNAGANVLRLLPPLIVSEEEIEMGVDAIASVLPE